MRIAVTGRKGQLVLSLMERGIHLGHEVVPLGRPEIDLAADPQSVIDAIEAVSPQVIVSAAAYTAVDRAETEPELAFAINEQGALSVAEAAARLHVPLVHISTDYVFDGTKIAPYVETDATSPTSVYGASKLAGEKAVRGAHENAAILRTAWVYSPFGTNFVKTMLRLANERDEITVVSDQVGNPTSAFDISEGVLRVASNLASSSKSSLRGIFHMSAGGEATWADFADAIFSASRAAGGAAARVRRITTAQFPTPAKRPANSRLDCSKLERAHGFRLPDWRTSLSEVVDRLVRHSIDGKVAQQ